MRIDQLFSNPTAFIGKNQPMQTASTSFSQTLSEALQKANETIVHSENMSEKVATGEIKNIHDVTIAAQKAQIALQMTTQVRDKVVEAYQEIMRMQV